MIISLWAVDPGGFTGWAWAPFDTERLRHVDAVKVVQDRMIGGRAAQGGDVRLGFACGVIRKGGPEGFLDLVRMVNSSKRQAGLLHGINKHRVKTLLVVEGFQLLPGSGVKSQSVQVPVKWLGMTELYLRLYPNWVDEYIVQLPAEKGVITDDRLRRWNLWFPQKDTRDAIRHLLVRGRKYLETA